jgi:signal transduction histidine kinase
MTEDRANDTATSAELTGWIASALTDALFVQSPLGVALYDAAGRVTLGNAAYERHFGIRVADVPPDYSLFGDPQLEASGLLPLIRRAYAGEPVVLPPVRYDAAQAARTTARTVWTQGHCFPVRDDAGAVTHVAIVHVDVTAWASADVALRDAGVALEERNTRLQEQQAELEHANRALESHAAELERQTRVMQAAAAELEQRTAAAERARERTALLQALTASLAGARSLDEVATVVVADMVAALGARTGALAGRAPDGDALVLLRQVGFPETVADGVRRQPIGLQSPLIACFRSQAPIWIETREGPDGLDERFPPIAPVWDALGVGSAAFVPLVAAGEVVGVISFAFEGARAFTPHERAFLLAVGQQAALAVERARLFEAERAARAEAEAANRAKAEFLATMSHELRTPLNAIGGYAELMELGIRGPVTDAQVEDLRRVQASQRHLLGLVNEVLNYARIETGTVRYDIADVPLGALVASVQPLVAPQLAAKAITFTATTCDPAPVARADHEKVRQVLINLLSNAIKFTAPRGRIDVTCELVDDGDGSTVAISVRDTGIGIAATELGRVFEPFVQVNASLTRTHEGTGLGLAISRDLARGMGGDLTATSTPGVGSTFTLLLPRARRE